MKQECQTKMDMNITAYDMHPPEIIHSKPRPTCFRQMIADAARNLHLRKQSAALLTFYANQANHFRPSLKMVAQHTGIHENKVSEVRNRLVKFGLIDFQAQAYVFIDWQRIKIYASLQTPLQLPQSKRYTFERADRWKEKKKQETIGSQEKAYRIKNPRNLSPEEDRFYSELMKFTVHDFTTMMEGIRQLEFPEVPAFPTTGVDNSTSVKSGFTDNLSVDTSPSESMPIIKQTDLPF